MTDHERKSFERRIGGEHAPHPDNPTGDEISVPESTNEEGDHEAINPPSCTPPDADTKAAPQNDD